MRKHWPDALSHDRRSRQPSHYVLFNAGSRGSATVDNASVFCVSNQMDAGVSQSESVGAFCGQVSPYHMEDEGGNVL